MTAHNVLAIGDLIQWTEQKLLTLEAALGQREETGPAPTSWGDLDQLSTGLELAHLGFMLTTVRELAAESGDKPTAEQAARALATAKRVQTHQEEQYRLFARGKKRQPRL